MIAWTIVGGIVLISLGYVGFIALAAVLEARAPQKVQCPDNHQVVHVKTEPGGAALAVFTGSAQTVNDCERWPEKAGCDRGCEKQL